MRSDSRLLAPFHVEILTYIVFGLIHVMMVQAAMATLGSAVSLMYAYFGWVWYSRGDDVDFSKLGTDS